MTTVKLQQGHYQGLSLNNVLAWRGIPFAQPPLAENRFRAPQPLPASDETCKADQFPLASLQAKNPLMGIVESSEDCLYLNVWAPENAENAPVMVWFHGGGYLAGSVSQPLYNGEHLAREQGVVVVNAAYRLGAHGFAYWQDVAPALQAESNLGLRDQVAALQWVQDNIAAFGGDNANVTVFGESAGGFSVACLMACPPASGLFQQAIVQSGAGDFVLTPKEASKVAQAFVDALPGEEDPAMKIRNASDRAWLKAQQQATKTLVARGDRTSTPQYAMNFLPVLDDTWLPQVPVDAIAAGAAKHVRLMAGVCLDEYHFFQYAGVLARTTTMDKLRAVDEAEITRYFSRALPQHGEAAWSYYQAQVQVSDARSQLDIFSAMESDRLFRVPTLRLLDAHAKHNSDTWGFQFTWQSKPFGLDLGACHVVDIPFVFGVTDTPAGLYFTGGGEAAAALSATVQNAWGQFAHGATPGWPCWGESRQAVQFGPGEPFAPLLDNDAERLWEAIIPDVAKA